MCVQKTWNNSNKWLADGEQTKRTPEIKKVAAVIEGRGLEIVANILLWIDKNLQHKLPEKVDETEWMNKRTAHEVIQDGYCVDCGDVALVFVALARAKGLSTKFVEALSRSWLEGEDETHVHGHAFAEVFVDRNWILVDPRRLLIKVVVDYENFFQPTESFVKLSEGLDPWTLGWHNFTEFRRDYLEFKRNWAERNEQTKPR